MSKKQIIKNIKRNQKNESKINEKDGFYKFVTSLTVIILILILCYVIIAIFVTKEINFNDTKSNDDNKNEEVSFDNSIITGGQIFDQKDSKYYVIIYDFDSKLTILPTYISNYSIMDNSIPIYKVDSSNKLNSKYITEKDSNKNPTTYSDLKIISPTLIEIDNSKVVKYIEGEDEIKSILKNE